MVGVFGAFIPSAHVAAAGRLASIALFVVLGARTARTGPMRIMALVTMALVVAVTFGGELLDPIGVPGIWFPFGIGVSLSQYIYAVLIPMVPAAKRSLLQEVKLSHQDNEPRFRAQRIEHRILTQRCEQQCEIGRVLRRASFFQ